MTLEQWKSDEQLTSWASKVFASAQGRSFLEMLHDSHIKNSQRGDLGNPCQVSSELGKIYGYDQCLNNIESAAKLQKPRKSVEETWGVIPETEQPKTK